MSKLAAALAWAARGFRIFPLSPDTKDPAFEGAWYEHATTDADIIRTYWTDPVLKTERDYNIGVDCTDMVVVDIDVKDGKDGYNQYMQLGGTFETLVVQTPSGGYHCYFVGPDSSNTNIAKDIEIRSHHGYVVAPGSTIHGVPYSVINDQSPAWINYEVEKLLQPVYVRPDYTSELITLDSEANRQAGINYLESTDVAIEGQRGDETTFITAARLVRELGLSTWTAFELMRDHWNERCVPPWQLDELLQKVENAQNYGSAIQGRLDPQLAFAAVSVTPPPSVFNGAASAWGNAVPSAAIRPRRWLVDQLLMLGKVSLIGATGSAGKSTVALALAAHVVQGLDFAGRKTHQAGKVVIYNGEDDKEEMSRRLLATCIAYGFDYDTVKNRILMMTYEDVNMKIVTAKGRGDAARNDIIANGLLEIIRDPEVILFIGDPFVDMHTCDEQDPGQMNVVMSVLQDIADTSDTAVLILHHTTKTGTQRQEERIGNMDIFRGSSSIVYKCRAAFTLMDASAEDAADYGLQDHERHMWARMDDAKVNFALRGSNSAVWFKRTGIKIASGDTVGVLHHQELTKSVQHLRIRIAELLINTMVTNGSGSMSITQAVAVVKDGEPLMANRKDTEIKQRIESSFATALQIREHTIRVSRETIEGKSDKVHVVLT